MTIQLVFTTAPNTSVANELAQELVCLKLAACVKLLAPCSSIYRWKGEIENATEILLVMITDESRYPDLEVWLKKAHPYDVPELIAISCSNGLPEYLKWVSESTDIQT